MKKNKKERDYYTINKELYEVFIEHINKENLNKSKLIESLIEGYLSKINYPLDKKNG